MKVSIDRYRGDLIPIQRLERAYEVWRSDSFYLEDEDKRWYDKLILGTLDKLWDVFLPINRWWNQRQRHVKVRIDHYDVWDAGHTLALIAHPLLVKLKEQKHGYPHVDNDDVPEELRATPEAIEALQYDGTTDAMYEARWDWVLDEIIWTFAQHAMDDDDQQFHHNSDQLTMVSTPLEDNPKLFTIDMNYQKDPSKPPYWVDEEGRKAHQARKERGMKLFARYYGALWD